MWRLQAEAYSVAIQTHFGVLLSVTIIRPSKGGHIKRCTPSVCPSIRLSDYHINKAFSLVKCIWRYVWNGAADLFGLEFDVNRSTFDEDMRVIVRVHACTFVHIFIIKIWIKAVFMINKICSVHASGSRAPRPLFGNTASLPSTGGSVPWTVDYAVVCFIVYPHAGLRCVRISWVVGTSSNSLRLCISLSGASTTWRDYDWPFYGDGCEREYTGEHEHWEDVVV